jgi:hypothetical protein
MACTKFTDVTEVSKAEDLNRSSGIGLKSWELSRVANMHCRHVSWDNVQVVVHVSNFEELVVLVSKACIGRNIAFRGSDPWCRGRLTAHSSVSHI